MRDGHFVSHRSATLTRSQRNVIFPKDWDYWSAYDRLMIAASRTVVVLTLDGWEKSIGVTAEMASPHQ